MARVRLVERRALLDDLDSMAAPLVVVSAPAGAGKTTLLRQWAESDTRPFAWVQVDEADSDPIVLLTFLCQALDCVTDVDPSVHASLSLAVPPLRERVLPLLGEALAEAPPFVLVLDDAHVLRGTKPWDIVAFFLRGLPGGAQLAIGSRADPALPLARMRAAGEVVEVRADRLSLDAAEVAQLLHLHGCEADDETAQALLEVTEGWATGLQLACLAGASRPTAEWLGDIRGGRREIAEYLTSEVLDAQPVEVQEFLLRTSVLLELTPRLCTLVTVHGDAGELLGRVARDELFVVPLGDDGCHYRYHHLFAEMLQDELDKRHPGLPDELHRTVARWYAQEDLPDQAVHHLLASGDASAAGELVAAAWPGMWNRGQAETVRRWLSSFTDRQILAQPALTLTAGWVYSALDAGRLGVRWCEAACGAPMTDIPSPDGAASLRSSQALLRATVGAHGVRQMRESAELAARLEATPGTSWYADAQVALGVARWLSGATQRALHPLAVGAREGSVCNQSAELAAIGYLALIAADESEWEVAAEYEAKATDLLTSLGFGTHRRCLPMLLTRVKLRSREGRAEGQESEDDVLRLLRHMVPHPWMALMAEVVLGEAAIERADMAAVERHAVAAQTRLEKYGDAGILRRRAERLLEAVERTRLAEPLTPAERRVLELLPTHLTDAQMAEQLFVSRNTVKTHLKSLYRKLEVSSRADAVGRARELALLSRE
jgi:LuxR family maltose regulon positive regulatory protein